MTMSEIRLQRWTLHGPDYWWCREGAEHSAPFEEWPDGPFLDGKDSAKLEAEITQLKDRIGKRNRQIRNLKDEVQHLREKLGLPKDPDLGYLMNVVEGGDD